MRAFLPSTKRLFSQVMAMTLESERLRQELVEQTTLLQDQVNRLTGLNNELTGRNNELTGEIGKLTGERNELVGNLQARTRENKELVERFDDLQASMTVVMRRNDALVAQVDGTAGRPPAPPEETAPAAPALMEGEAKARAGFLVVSNMRSGSTWLQAMLGALPDVFTDYEFKFGINYRPSTGHLVVTPDGPTVTETLARFPSDRPVVGSKLVFDAVGLSKLDLDDLKGRLGPGLRVVHLVRPLRDVFLSRRRGFYHQLEPDRGSGLGENIRAALVKADIGQARRIHEPGPIAALDCWDELRTYIQNDARARSLSASSADTLLVRYADVAARLAEIAAFVGSAASAAEVAAVVERPPVRKLPAVEASEWVSNMAELEPVFARAEALRDELLRAA